MLYLWWNEWFVAIMRMECLSFCGVVTVRDPLTIYNLSDFFGPLLPHRRHHCGTISHISRNIAPLQVGQSFVPSQTLFILHVDFDTQFSGSTTVLYTFNMSVQRIGLLLKIILKFLSIACHIPWFIFTVSLSKVTIIKFTEVFYPILSYARSWIGFINFISSRLL